MTLLKKENFFTHLPMGSPPAKFSNYPCFGNELPKHFFLKKISLIRKFISENTSWGVRSEMNIRKHLMGGEFGSLFPNYAETFFFFFMFFLKRNRILIKRYRQIK